MAVLSQRECPISPRVTVKTTDLKNDLASPCATNVFKDVRAIIAVLITSMTTAMIQAYKRHQSRRALHRLNDNQLWDIGLTRRGNDYRPTNHTFNRF